MLSFKTIYNRSKGMIDYYETKSQPITRVMVWQAYKEVKSNAGSGGIDKMSWEHLEKNQSTELYMLWNRLSSGSYYPKAVKQVAIPKKDGGVRYLGIPTILDRIAQQVVRKHLERKVEPMFHNSSFGYRPKRSCHDAVQQANANSFNHDFAIDLDIKGFFDNIDHELLLKAVGHYCSDKWVLMYVERWLKAGVVQQDGSFKLSLTGTPQGGVIALRTHSQTLTMLTGLLLKEEDFNFGYFIKSITFMKNEKITEFGISRKNQSGACLVGATETAYTYYRAVNGDVWCISNTGLSLCSTGQREQRADCHSGEFSGFYSKTATQSDWSCKGICGLTGNFDQQSSQGGVGRVFSKKTPWPKRRGSLKYRFPMTASGSKSSHRFTISLSQGSQALFSQNILSIITL